MRSYSTSRCETNRAETPTAVHDEEDGWFVIGNPFGARGYLEIGVRSSQVKFGPSSSNETMIENVAAQNSAFLIGQQESASKGSPKKDQVEMHGLRRTSVSVESHQFINRRWVDRNSERENRLPWGERHIGP